jgi:superfamily II DNA/RNA helicase
MSEEDRWKEEELWETLSVAGNRQELEREILTISGLIEKSRSIIQNEKEEKLLQLKASLEKLSKKHPNKKILIFTEAKDTLDYLERKIKSWGYSVNVIHGGMKLEERVGAEKIFKNETQVLVATEAAGEGINLQFCHLMINYDIPWNPNRLEQRMGRIHRYGQTLEVHVFNMVAEDTREGKVLRALFEKLEEIKNTLHSDKVFDVISEVLYGKNLAQLLLDAAASARDIDQILKEINVNVDAEYISRVRESLGESLATRYLDYTRLKEMAQKAMENRLIPEYTEAFFKKAIIKAAGRIKERKDGFLTVDLIPFEVRTLGNEDSFKKNYGTLLRSYPKVTFDKEVALRNADAEFVSFGHPLFEAVLEWSDRTLGPELQKGAIFTDPDGKMDGFIAFYQGEVSDGTGAVAGRSLFAYYYDNNTGNIESTSPTIIWDLVDTNGSLHRNIDLEMLKEKALERIVHNLKTYVETIREERNRQAAIKEKYGINSLNKLIVDIDGELINLNIRKERGENVDLAIRNTLRPHHIQIIILMLSSQIHPTMTTSLTHISQTFSMFG